MNWFTYLPYSPNSSLKKRDIRKLYRDRMNSIILEEVIWHIPFSHLPWNKEQLFIQPLVITPILNKEIFFSSSTYNRILQPLWWRAEHALSKCNSLVLIGYSFPPTDFYTKKLFLEAFATNSLHELIVINPDKTVAKKAKTLTRFTGKVRRYNSLEDFFKSNP